MFKSNIGRLLKNKLSLNPRRAVIASALRLDSSLTSKEVKLATVVEGDQKAPFSIATTPRRCPWCNGYRLRNWTRRYEFKSWTRLIAFHIALIPMGKI